MSCILLTAYLVISCVCICTLSGIDGNKIRHDRTFREKFKDLPLSDILFKGRTECSICLEEFREGERVIQLPCH